MIRIACCFSAGLVALAFPLAAVPRTDITNPPRADAPKYTLRYRFRSGETLRWEVVHRKKIDTTVSGITQTAETRSRSVKVWQVCDVGAEGTVTFEHLVESVDMWQKLSGRPEVRYDSQTDEKPPLGFEHVAQSVGVPLSVITMNATGKILKRKRKPRPATAQGQGPMTIPLPEQPVAVGDTWSVPENIEIRLNTGGIKRIKARQQFTLQTVKTGVATIHVATQVLTPIDDPALEAQLIQRQSSGTVRFDVDAGRIIGQRMDLDKRVVGYPNPASSFHYVTRFTEKLLPATTRTASGPTGRPR